MKAILGAMLLLTAGAAHAAGPCGDGRMATMRVSAIGKGGTAAGFAEAVRDHSAWYRTHGLADDIVLTGPTLVPRKGGMAASATRFVTLHIYGGTAAPKHDAAWDAYVAKYKANATIVSETRMCLPKGAMSSG